MAFSHPMIPFCSPKENSEAHTGFLCSWECSRLGMLLRPAQTVREWSACTTIFGNKATILYLISVELGITDAYLLGSHRVVYHYSRGTQFTSTISWEKAYSTENQSQSIGKTLSWEPWGHLFHLTLHFQSQMGLGSEISMGSENVYHQDNVTSELRRSLGERQTEMKAACEKSKSSISSHHLGLLCTA